MITIEYLTQIENRNTLNLVNRIGKGATDSMQLVLDKLVQNIQGHFSDTDLANTVTQFIQVGGVRTSADIVIEGNVTSTWANMIWYEVGREPGGKMPPRDAILAYCARHNITPDVERSAIAFAYAINVARQRRGKHAVPVDVLVEWQNKNGIVVPEELAQNSMAYAIGKKIVREGIPGRHYFEMGLNDTREFINNSFEQVVISTTGF